MLDWPSHVNAGKMAAASWIWRVFEPERRVPARDSNKGRRGLSRSRSWLIQTVFLFPLRPESGPTIRKTHSRYGLTRKTFEIILAL